MLKQRWLRVIAIGAMFPQWRNHVFVALFGANSRDPLIGKSVVRVELARGASGQWSGSVHAWASGFANPLDVSVGPDGAIYVADFGAGKVYRFAAAPSREIFTGVWQQPYLASGGQAHLPPQRSGVGSACGAEDMAA